jgi:sterol desaturase/sphingolipid hydroxylase (fatty acid hydroxylase superfamily)
MSVSFPFCIGYIYSSFSAHKKCKTMTDNNRLKYLISCLTWPMLMIVCIAITAYGFSIDKAILFFNFAYLFLVVSLLFLERYIPHEPEWNEDDGQFFPNIYHTLSSKGTVQVLFVFSAAMGLAHIITPATESGYSVWPRDWPLWAQVILGVYAAEFGLYWAHRIAHEWWPLWRFHSIHHSVTKLWVINTGRFHFVDSLVSIILGMAILLALGAPMEVLKWLSAITAFIGMLTHCNVDMRFGSLSWIFNTPGLHRWHHSRDLGEANNNYGENVMIWDLLFRTYYNPNRRPPADIGINEYMPPTFSRQIQWPFLKQRYVTRKKRPVVPSAER